MPFFRHQFLSGQKRREEKRGERREERGEREEMTVCPTFSLHHFSLAASAVAASVKGEEERDQKRKREERREERGERSHGALYRTFLCHHFLGRKSSGGQREVTTTTVA
jgi:hypothetical protein